MEQNGQGGRAARGVNQNMVIAIIGAVATVVAALIPSFIKDGNSQTAPSAAATMAALPSETPLPLPTFTFTPESIATGTFTPTALPPTETPTTPVGIYDVYLAVDKAGQNRSTTFGPLQTVYIFFSVNDPSGQNLVRVQWLTLDVPGRISGSPLGGDESRISTPKFSFEITLSPWPIGTYKVVLYLNGSPVSTQEFEIK